MVLDEYHVDNAFVSFLFLRVFDDPDETKEIMFGVWMCTEYNVCKSTAHTIPVMRKYVRHTHTHTHYPHILPSYAQTLSRYGRRTKAHVCTVHVQVQDRPTIIL